jgi:hypothetical protein
MDMPDEKQRANDEEEYNPNDFEWRFQQTLKVHKEKLEALPDERRKGVEEGLRRKFEEHEKDFFALDGHANYFEELDSLFEKQERGTAQHVDRAHQASGGVKGQQKDVDQKKEYAKKLRDDLKAKTPQEHQQDHDHER